jgi:hypothetical protein
MSSAFGCRGNTIRLRSGRTFDLAAPRPEQFTIEDIAGALAKLCRYGGHVPRFYSVAEHSVRVCWQATKDGLNTVAERIALLHDAAEAFTGDLVKPLKIMLPDFAAVEARIEAVIAAKYRLDFPAEREAVKEIDRAMLIAEKRFLFPDATEKWTGEGEVRRLDVKLDYFSPQAAEQVFLTAAGRLGVLDFRWPPDWLAEPAAKPFDGTYPLPPERRAVLSREGKTSGEAS